VAATPRELAVEGEVTEHTPHISPEALDLAQTLVALGEDFDWVDASEEWKKAQLYLLAEAVTGLEEQLEATEQRLAREISEHADTEQAHQDALTAYQHKIEDLRRETLKTSLLTKERDAERQANREWEERYNALRVASSPAIRPCDHEGCTNTAVIDDAWGWWCDEHDGGQERVPAINPHFEHAGNYDGTGLCREDTDPASRPSE